MAFGQRAFVCVFMWMEIFQSTPIMFTWCGLRKFTMKHLYKL